MDNTEKIMVEDKIEIDGVRTLKDLYDNYHLLNPTVSTEYSDYGNQVVLFYMREETDEEYQKRIDDIKKKEANKKKKAKKEILALEKKIEKIKTENNL